MNLKQDILFRDWYRAVDRIAAMEETRSSGFYSFHWEHYYDRGLSPEEAYDVFVREGDEA